MAESKTTRSQQAQIYSQAFVTDDAQQLQRPRNHDVSEGWLEQHRPRTYLRPDRLAHIVVQPCRPDQSARTSSSKPQGHNCRRRCRRRRRCSRDSERAMVDYRKPADQTSTGRGGQWQGKQWASRVGRRTRSFDARVGSRRDPSRAGRPEPSPSTFPTVESTVAKRLVQCEESARAHLTLDRKSLRHTPPSPGR